MAQRIFLYSSDIKRTVAFLVFLFPIQVVLSFSPVFESFVARGLALLILGYGHQDLPLAEPIQRRIAVLRNSIALQASSTV